MSSQTTNQQEQAACSRRSLLKGAGAGLAQRLEKNKQDVKAVNDYLNQIKELEAKTQAIINGANQTGTVLPAGTLAAQYAGKNPVKELSQQVLDARKKLQNELGRIGLEGYLKEKTLLDQELEANLKFKENATLAHQVYRAKLTALDEKYAEKAQDLARSYSGEPEGPVSNDPGTEEGGSLGIRKPMGYGIGKILRNNRVLPIATMGMEPCGHKIITKVLIPSLTEFRFSTA